MPLQSDSATVPNACCQVLDRNGQRVPRKVVKSTDTLLVYCDCQMPKDNIIVQCIECEEWYHIYCVDVP